MTTLSLERLTSPRRSVRTARRTPVRNGIAAWSALISRSRQAAADYDRAPTTSARHKVLVQFADSGA